MGEPAYLVIASAAPAPTNYTAPGHGLSWSSHTAVFYFPLISQEHAWQEAADLYHSKCFSSVGQLVYPSVPCSHPSGYCPHGLRQVWEHTFTKVLPWSIQDRLQLESRFKGEKPFQHFQCAICSYQQKQTAMESWCWVSICRAPLTISTPCLKQSELDMWSLQQRWGWRYCQQSLLTSAVPHQSACAHTEWAVVSHQPRVWLSHGAQLGHDKGHLPDVSKELTAWEHLNTSIQPRRDWISCCLAA